MDEENVTHNEQWGRKLGRKAGSGRPTHMLEGSQLMSEPGGLTPAHCQGRQEGHSFDVFCLGLAIRLQPELCRSYLKATMR